MIVSAEIEVIRHQVNKWHKAGETVAFVPTMGNLHQGHISLVIEGLKHADHVVASIYVNPMQFAAHEDLDTYPRTMSDDLSALESVGCELVFTPETDTIYPQGVENHTRISVPEFTIGNCAESASRPGFFTGVATVVTKLFNIVQPDVAMFGQKDYQQLIIIKALVKDLALPIRVIGVETHREANGLAMSSRNNYLSESQRDQAGIIKQAMDKLAVKLKSGSPMADAIELAKQQIESAQLTVDYVLVRNAETMTEVTTKNHNLVILVAAHLGSTRLIDNMCFSLSEKE
ncbi:MAG: pantoate--beta-alanine ligase [Parashewanella sp.]